jgi:hypothetical protein
MKLYCGVAVGVCVGAVLYLCSHRSCGVTEGATGGRNSRVFGDGVGGDCGRIRGAWHRDYRRKQARWLARQ